MWVVEGDGPYLPGHDFLRIDDGSMEPRVLETVSARGWADGQLEPGAREGEPVMQISVDRGYRQELVEIEAKRTHLTAMSS